VPAEFYHRRLDERSRRKLRIQNCNLPLQFIEVFNMFWLDVYLGELRVYSAQLFRGALKRFELTGKVVFLMARMNRGGKFFELLFVGG